MKHQPKAATAPEPSLLPTVAHRRFRKDVRLAAVYESDILPVWGQRFGRLLLRHIELPPKAMVLDAMCATGYVSLALLSRLGDGVRVVAVDPSSAMLDVARSKAAAAGVAQGRRLFFRSEPVEPGLPFASDVFDLVLSNLGLWDVAQPRRLLHEMVRVARPGARVAATMPLWGTFAELFELFSAVLEARGLREAEQRLGAYISSMPSLLEAKSWLVEAGLEQPRVECVPFSLLFGSGRELFFAPLIEYGHLPDWKEAVGPTEVQEVFWQLKDAIDQQLRPTGGAPWRPFVLTVRAACLSGRKPVEPAVPNRPQPPRVEPDVVELGTGEFDIIGNIPRADPWRRR
ncbi:MAG: methyltransferase domain-containing protein [Myxococcales bacterium]|nr:methyltransferase domain-containing protein [Myxococcota bacterium]MDW8280418.1 methyltransferase domain-containing protein [Myxococcales bacterium]